MVERILVAARQVLARDGYARFSTYRVADAAGVSPGSLYQYFHDKDELLTVVLDRYWDEVATRVSASLADRFADPPERMVHNTVDALLAALEQDSQLLRVVVTEIPLTVMHERRTALRRHIQEIGSAYLSATSSRAPARAPVPTRAWVVVAAMEGLALRWVLDDPGISREEMVAELTLLVERYLR